MAEKEPRTLGVEDSSASVRPPSPKPAPARTLSPSPDKTRSSLGGKESPAFKSNRSLSPKPSPGRASSSTKMSPRKPNSSEKKSPKARKSAFAEKGALKTFKAAVISVQLAQHMHDGSELPDTDPVDLELPRFQVSGSGETLLEAENPDNEEEPESFASVRPPDPAPVRYRSREERTAAIQAAMETYRTEQVAVIGAKYTSKNVIAFAVCYGLIIMLRTALSFYMFSTSELLRRRYFLDNTSINFVQGMQKVGFILMLIFIAYYGNKVHKPMAILGGAIVTACGGFLCLLPHFVTCSVFDSSPDKGDNSDLYFGLCEVGQAWTQSGWWLNSTCTDEFPRIDASDSTPAFPILSIGELLIGVGSATMATLGFVYMDEAGRTEMMPLTIGITLCMNGFGEILGVLMHRAVAINHGVVIDGVRVGWWWVGFLILSLFLALSSLSMLPFPRFLKEPRWLLLRRLKHKRVEEKRRAYEKELRRRVRARRRSRQRRKEQRKEDRAEPKLELFQVEGAKAGAGGKAEVAKDKQQANRNQNQNAKKKEKQKKKQKAEENLKLNENHNANGDVKKDLSETDEIEENQNQSANKGAKKEKGSSKAGASADSDGESAQSTSSIVLSVQHDGMKSSSVLSSIPDRSSDKSLEQSTHKSLAQSSLKVDENLERKLSVRKQRESVRDVSPRPERRQKESVRDVSEKSKSERKQKESIRDVTDKSERKQRESVRDVSQKSQLKIMSAKVITEENDTLAIAQIPESKSRVSAKSESRGSEGKKEKDGVHPSLSEESQADRREALDDAEELKRYQREKNRKKKQKLGRNLRDLPQNLWYLLTHMVFLIPTLGCALALYLQAGFYPVLPHYLHVHFFYSQEEAAEIAGVIFGFSQACGPLLTGAFIWKFRLKLTTQYLMAIALMLTTCVGIGILFPLGCDQTFFQHQSEDTSNMDPLTGCLLTCGCEGAAPYDVCTPRHELFPSPCHAGCTTVTTATNGTIIFSDCYCQPDLEYTVSADWCQKECMAKVGFGFLLCVTILAQSSCHVTAVLTFLRALPEKMRSLSLGFALWLAYLASYVPGVAVYDGLANRACTQWLENDMGIKTCWRYSLQKHRYSVNATSLVTQALALVVLIVVTCKALTKKEEEKTDKEEVEPISSQSAPDLGTVNHSYSREENAENGREENGAEK